MDISDHLERVHVSITVWGETYCSLFLAVGVPNLCALVEELPEVLRAQSRVRIFTTTADLSRFETAEQVACLRRRIAVDLVEAVVFAGFDTYGRYAPMVVAQARAVVEASREGAAIIFMGPDLVFSKGAFRLFIERARQGYRAIVGPGMRVVRKSVAPVLREKIEGHPAKLLELSPNELSDLTFDHWHHVNDLFIWNSPQSVHWKAHLIYRISGNDVLMRFFQGATFFAWPRSGMAEYRGFIDHALVASCCERYDQVYVVPDLSECLACDLMAAAEDERMPRSAYRELDLLKEMLGLDKINRFNIRYGLRTCRVHRAEAADDEWRRHARRLAREVDPILKLALLLRTIPRIVVLLRAGSLGRSLRWGGNFMLRAFARVTARVLAGPVS